MASLPIRFVLFLLAGLLLAPTSANAAESLEQHGFKALVFSKTAGFRHASIADGIAAITALATEHDFEVTFTEDAQAFTTQNLAQYDVIVFLNTTGDVLDDTQQAAMEAFIQAGGGFVGVHAAADTEYDWAWYGGLVGAYFDSHPEIQQAEVRVLDTEHPSTSHLPRRWTRTDEWYNYQTNPRGEVHVLATLDEGSYSGGNMGADHPIAWCHGYDGGRAWYTGGGHTSEAYSEPAFRTHLVNGLEWAAGVVAGDCGGTVWGNYQVIPIETDVDNPMMLKVANDGRVFFVERGGRVRLYDPTSGQTSNIGTLPVFANFEDGLLGIELDPAFDTNGWIYLFYSPLTGGPRQRVSRFVFDGSSLDMSSERVLLEIPVQRDECCHSGGDLEFGPDGSLFISTGDNTNPFADGYAPIDERAGREPWDAQGSSGNTNDLRGKVLRILPQADGTYTTPADNLFPDGTDGRAEIYAMGTRNPFRIAVDPNTGWLYWGDVGPDATGDSGARGPRGYDEWNQARTAGNYGWPFCIADNQAYRDFSYATQSSGALFDCANGPTNDSPNNTGATTLPPAQPAWIWYPYGAATDFPGVTAGSGRTAIAGPVYQHQPDQVVDSPQLPAAFQDAVFIAEWTRNWLHVVTLDDEGQPLAISPFLPNETFIRPLAFEQGPDGALYVIEWGTGFGGNNPDAQIVRIEYAAGSRSPIAEATATPTAGLAPLTVSFSSEGTRDPDPGDALSYAWDFDGDGTADATTANASHTYTDEGRFVASLLVTDLDGNEGRAFVTITVGNTPPTVTMATPVEGGFFDWSDTVPFSVGAADAEDGSTEAGTIACADVGVQAFIGHDQHSHPLEVQNGCTGAIEIADGHGDDGEELFYLVEATYTDAGEGSVGALTGRTLHRLQPRTKEAEHYTSQSGVELEASEDPLGGEQQLAFIDHGDYAVYDPVNLTGITHVTFRVASAGRGGRIELRADAADGELLGTAYVSPTGGWQVFESVTAAISDPGRTIALYLLFQDTPGAGGLFNVNKMRFHGHGVAEAPAEPRGFSVAYYDHPDFAGTPLEGIEPVLNYNWQTRAPADGLSASSFSAAWAGNLTFPSSGGYTLSAVLDGHLVVQVDGEVELDETTTSEQEVTGTVRIAAGTYPIRVFYRNTSGAAQLSLRWSGPGLAAEDLIQPEAVTPLAIDVAREAGPSVPAHFGLAAPFPNPADRQTTLRYTLPTPERVQVEIVDLLGRTVLTALDQPQAAGAHALHLATATLASGVYLCRLVAGGRQATQQLVVVH